MNGNSDSAGCVCRRRIGVPSMIYCRSKKIKPARALFFNMFKGSISLHARNLLQFPLFIFDKIANAADRRSIERQTVPYQRPER